MIKKQTLLTAALLQAIVATGGSLYFSEVMKFTPCKLCWLQRIFMYPLVLIFLVALFRKDRNAVYYIVPLSVSGWIIALFHNLEVWGIIKETATNFCRVGESCATQQFSLFGWITIPLMSLTAFTVINVLMLAALRQKDNSEAA